MENSIFFDEGSPKEPRNISDGQVQRPFSGFTMVNINWGFVKLANFLVDIFEVEGLRQVSLACPHHKYTWSLISPLPQSN